MCVCVFRNVLDRVLSNVCVVFERRLFVFQIEVYYIYTIYIHIYILVLLLVFTLVIGCLYHSVDALSNLYD